MLWGFKIVYLNVNCLVNKFDYVKEFVYKYFFDILIFFEIWLVLNILDNEIMILGYLFVCKDR